MKKYLCINLILALTPAACGQTGALPASVLLTSVPASPAPTALPLPAYTLAPTSIVPTTTPIAATYQGLALPTPLPAGPDLLQPPPAWLIVGGSAVLATGGNTSITRKSDSFSSHADALAPQQSRALVTAALPGDAKAVIVIGSRSITTFQARVQAWAAQPTAIFFDPLSGRPLKAEEQRDGDITVFTLEPIGDAGDQLLAVSINFDDSYSSGDASYVWRLNPAT